MQKNTIISGLVLALMLSAGSAATIAAAAKAANPKAAEAAKLIDYANKARMRAASVDGEWRDTAKFIKKAKALLKEGKYDAAIKLAKKAKREGELGYEQAVSQKNLTLPSYLGGGPVMTTMASASSMAASKSGKITPSLTRIDVLHRGKPVTITRVADKNAAIPETYAKVGRACPPFCIQPMQIADGVKTVGELEVLDILKRIGEGDPKVLVVDSRTSDWMRHGTIPGSVNIPWNKINIDLEGTFENETEAKTLRHILHNDFGARLTNGHWDFRNAKTLVLFCNGLWCPQSGANIKTLIKLGYPAYKLKWYRGGMQDWASAGLTMVYK